MEITTLVLADGANTTQEGKLNILGVFNRVGPVKVPFILPSMTLVVRFEYHPSESGKHEFKLQVADADGRKVAEAGGEFEIPKRPGQTMPPNGQVVLPIQMAKFPKAGVYSFDISMDGRYEGSTLLEVVGEE